MAAIPGSYDNKCAHGVRHGTYECSACAATSWESKARSLWDKLKDAEARVRELERNADFPRVKQLELILQAVEPTVRRYGKSRLAKLVDIVLRGEGGK